MLNGLNTEGMPPFGGTYNEEDISTTPEGDTFYYTSFCCPPDCYIARTEPSAAERR
jgi:hypothetical protein